MGGSPYIIVDGVRMTPYMKYQLDRLSAMTFSLFNVYTKARSAIRLHQEQIDIFLQRYVTAANIRGRRVYDTRVWQGVRYYRISDDGTVAPPGYSNHEVQGSDAAFDLYDTGVDAGIASWGSRRANWLRANCGMFDMVAEGYNFREAWHYKIRNIFKTPPAGSVTVGGTTNKPSNIIPKEVINMATEIIVTEKNNGGKTLADKDRRAAFVNTDSGFNCVISWLTIADADKLAKVAGMPAGAYRMTDAGFDKFIEKLNEG